MVHYAKYVKENGYDVPYTEFLPVLMNLEKFLPPVPPEICYPDYGCFNNFESFKCLDGAIPDDPNEMSFHLRMVFKVKRGKRNNTGNRWRNKTFLVAKLDIYNSLSG